MMSSQITVTTSPTLLVASSGSWREIYLHIVGNSHVFIGNAQVTTSNGFYYDKNTGVTEIKLPPDRQLYGIVTTGTEVVSVLIPSNA